MLRSQKAAATAGHPAYGPPPPSRPRQPGRAARSLRAPAACEGEIDVEYGAEDDTGEMEYGNGGGAEQPGGEWWAEGAQADHHRTRRRATRAEQLVNQGVLPVSRQNSPRPPRPSASPT